MFPRGEREVDDRPVDRQGAAAVLRPRRHRGWLGVIPIVSLVSALLIAYWSGIAAGPRLSVCGDAVPGAAMMVVGNGFNASTWVQLQWDGSAAGLSRVRTSNQDTLGTSLMIPANATPGPHLVGAGTLPEREGLGVPAATAVVLASAEVMVLDPAAPMALGPGPATDPTQIAAFTPSAAPTFTPSAAPTPTPQPGIPGVYGPAIGMDSLNNTRVGGPEAISTSYRFRASTSSKLNSIRIYVVGPTHAGYGAGTGGTWQVSVRADDGTPNHAPSDTVLATTTFKPVDGLPVISWSSPASLTFGQLYHIVFENIDPNPETNYASVDGVFMYQPTAPRQAAFSDVDWGQPMRYASGAWSDRSDTVPIMGLDYANGVTAGLGYMEVWVRSPASISGNAEVREAFTVSGPNRAVSSFSVRLMRISGTSPLTVRLETSGGTLIEQGTISATDVAVGTPGDHAGSGHATWETYTFDSPRTLVSGEGYNVVLSTASDTVYSIFVIRKGTSHGFSPTTYFSDGHAQCTTGASWGPFRQDGGGALDQGDLQFYFR